MPSTIECPLCKRTLNLPEDGAGLPVRCPKCYGVFTLDAPAAVTTNPKPAPVLPQHCAPATDGDEEARQRYRDDDEDEFDDFHRVHNYRLHIRPHRSGTIQSLGILSIVFCWMAPIGGILGLIGVILGGDDLSEIAAGRMDPEGRSVTQTGRTCSIIGLVLSSVIFFMYLILRVR